MTINHLEFWEQLEARIREQRAVLQGSIDNSDHTAEAALRMLIGERRGLQAVQRMAREVYAEMTGTTVQPPEQEPQDDFPV